jgi:hypothetical protein
MKSNLCRGAAALLLALALLPTAARAEDPEGHVMPLKEPAVIAVKTDPVHPFAAMAGNWTGGGTIDLTNDIRESLRCRAQHTYGQASSSLALSIRCASDNYKFELTSNVVERNGQISGKWSEVTYKAAGTISGRVAGNRVSAVAHSDSLTTNVVVTTSGNRQTVTITPERTYVISVKIALSRR